jgi:translocator protein
MIAVVRLLAFVLIPLLVGAGSGFVTAAAVRDWYPTLVRPSFAPPAWVFGPVWTVLYCMMGFAAWLVWRKGGRSAAGRVALGLFALQLVLNGLWSLLFFGMRAPGVALIEIVVLWAAIAVTLGAFRRVDAVAGWLLVPYLAWVTFATVLNAGFWWLNRSG